MLDPLPALLVLTDRVQAERAGHRLHDLVAMIDGSREVALVFREKDLVGEERASLGRRLAAAARGAGIRFVVASDADLARELDADGVHLAESDDAEVGPGLTVGRSCHDMDSVRRAIEDSVAYVTVSPVFETTSKPGYGPALGIAGLEQIVCGTGLPVYALGGVTVDRARACVDAGAVGVAVMGAVMGADDPAAVSRALLDEVLAARLASRGAP